LKRAVVLAAGMGQRLGERTIARPKPLVPLAGRPIIKHTLSSLAAAGIEEVVVVSGYRGDELEAALSDERQVHITFVSNPDFARGASYSLRAARQVVGEEPFLLTMSDHLLSRELIVRLAAAADEAPDGMTALVATDDPESWDEAYLAEATRVDVDDESRIRHIGKMIDHWTAIDAGAFACFPNTWSCVEVAPDDCDLSTIFRVAAASGSLGAADISGTFWYDVDTEDDLQAAERLLRRS
jgi:1L-myo-inositol 1-phosphate cytidylyltransferase